MRRLWSQRRYALRHGMPGAVHLFDEQLRLHRDAAARCELILDVWRREELPASDTLGIGTFTRRDRETDMTTQGLGPTW